MAEFDMGDLRSAWLETLRHCTVTRDPAAPKTEERRRAVPSGFFSEVEVLRRVRRAAPTQDGAMLATSHGPETEPFACPRRRLLLRRRSGPPVRAGRAAHPRRRAALDLGHRSPAGPRQRPLRLCDAQLDEPPLADRRHLRTPHPGCDPRA